MLASKFCQLRVSNNYATLGGHHNFYQSPSAPKVFVSSSAGLIDNLSVLESKDPLKRSPSAFALFMKEIYQTKQVSAEKGKPLGSATVKIAEMWKSLDATKKSHYENMAGKLKQSRADNISKLTDKQILQLKARKVQSELKDMRSAVRRARLKDLHKIADTYGRPKKPTVLTIFMKSQPPRKSDQSLTEYVRDIGQKYRSLNEAEKKKLTEDYRKACEKYLSDMKGWENKMKADGKLKELEKFDRPKSVDEFLTEEKAKRMKRKAKQNAKMQELLKGRISNRSAPKKLAKKVRKIVSKRKPKTTKKSGKSTVAKPVE